VVNSIKIRGWEGMEWIGLAQYRDHGRDIVNRIVRLQVPQNDWKFWSGCTTGSFSRRTHLPGVS
jgi:hypothetical protein